jgi:hypothetical protein
MGKRVVLGVAVLASALAMFVASAAADTSAVTVRIPSCVARGGEVTVPAGSEVSFGFAWILPNQGLVHALLHGQTTTASLDATPIADADSFWSAPFADGDGYGTEWHYDTGVVLGAGESITLSFTTVNAHPLGGGGPGGKTPAGTSFDGTCTVTGV